MEIWGVHNPITLNRADETTLGLAPEAGLRAKLTRRCGDEDSKYNLHFTTQIHSAQSRSIALQSQSILLRTSKLL